MGPKLLMFILFLFFTCTLFSLAVEGGWLGDSEMDLVDKLTGFTYEQVQDQGGWGLVKMGTGFFLTGLPTVLFWQYSFLEGDLVILQLFLIVVLSVPIIWAVAQMFFGALSGIFGGLGRMGTS